MGQVYNRQTGGTLLTSPGCQTVSSVSLIVVCGFFCIVPVAVSDEVTLRENPRQNNWTELFLMHFKIKIHKTH